MMYLSDEPESTKLLMSTGSFERTPVVVDDGMHPVAVTRRLNHHTTALTGRLSSDVYH